MASTSNLLTGDEHTPTARPRSPTSFGVLGKLPLEIRYMIYEVLFAAGNVDLARVSKALQQDTEESLSEHGVCRVTVAHRLNPGHKVQAQLPTIPFHVRNLFFHIVRWHHVSCPLRTKPCNLDEFFQRAAGHLKKPKNLRLSFEIWEFDLYVVDSMWALPKFQAVNVEFESRDRLNMSNPLCRGVTMRRARRVAEHITDVLAPQSVSEKTPKLTVLCTFSGVTPKEWEHYLNAVTE